MKSYTDIEQSKKLAEILPLESADVVWVYSAFEDDYFPHFLGFRKIVVGGKDIKAWSLAALLDVLPKIVSNESLFVETSAALWHIGYRNIYAARAANLVDACCELILELHELKML